MGGGGGEIEKNIAAKEGKGGRRRGEGGWRHSWGGSIVINIYFLGSPPPNYSRCCRVLMHNRVSSLDTRLNRYIRAFELSACTRLAWKVVRFPNRSGKERRKRWWNPGRDERKKKKKKKRGRRRRGIAFSEPRTRSSIYLPQRTYPIVSNTAAAHRFYLFFPSLFRFHNPRALNWPASQLYVFKGFYYCPGRGCF